MTTIKVKKNDTVKIITGKDVTKYTHAREPANAPRPIPSFGSHA